MAWDYVLTTDPKPPTVVGRAVSILLASGERSRWYRPILLGGFSFGRTYRDHLGPNYITSRGNVALLGILWSGRRRGTPCLVRGQKWMPPP